MTTSLSTASNPPVAGLGAPAAPGLSPPTEAQLRVVPAGLAGAAGISPQLLVTPPTAESADTLSAVLGSARTTSPGVVPALNPAPPSLDPALQGSVVPAIATAADPRGLPGRTAAPGQHLGSTAPATPRVELGAQPFAAEVPPASAFGPPKEEHLRGVPAAVAGASGVSPQTLAGATPSLFYFLGPEPLTSPGAVPAPPQPEGAAATVLPASAGVPEASPYFIAEARAFAEKVLGAKTSPK